MLDYDKATLYHAYNEVVKVSNRGISIPDNYQ